LAYKQERRRAAAAIKFLEAAKQLESKRRDGAPRGDNTCHPAAAQYELKVGVAATTVERSTDHDKNPLDTGTVKSIDTNIVSDATGGENTLHPAAEQSDLTVKEGAKTLESCKDDAKNPSETDEAETVDSKLDNGTRRLENTIDVTAAHTTQVDRQNMTKELEKIQQEEAEAHKPQNLVTVGENQQRLEEIREEEVASTDLAMVEVPPSNTPKVNVIHIRS
jgi:hypothetical protein